MKTVFLAVPHYVFISDILRTKYLPYLALHYNVVVLTPFLTEKRAKEEGYYTAQNIHYIRYELEHPRFFKLMKELRISCVNEFDHLNYIKSWYKRPNYLNSKKRRILRAVALPFKRFLTADAFTNFERRWMPEPKLFNRLLDEYKPAAVLTATPGFNPWEAPIILQAQRKKIPTIAMNFSWDNLTANAKHIRKTDYLIVWNDIIKEEAISIHGYQKDKIFVSGIIRFDHYFVKQKNEPSREEFLKSKGLNPEYKTIFHTTVTKAYPFQKKYIRDLIRLRDENKIPYVNLFIRIHPRDVYDNYKEFFGKPDVVFEKAGRDVDNQTEMDFKDLLNLKYSLKYTDLNINYASTISLEASIFDTPIINIGYFGRFALAYDFDHYKPIVDSGAVCIAKTDEDLPKLINMYLQNPKQHAEHRKAIVNSHIQFTDGLSYKRSVDALKKIIEHTTMPKVLGVITARGGSKGIPGKNIKPLLGKPLIAYTIEAAKKSGVIDRLILSTDDPKIAEIAKHYGCEVPFMRPPELAQDQTPHLPVMQHAVRWMKDNEGYEPDYVMILQPTSPLRQPFHIKEAVEKIVETGADSVLSVAEVPKHYTPYKAMVHGDDGYLTLFSGNPIYKRPARRQDLKTTYWSVGSIYLFKPEFLFDKKNPNFYGDKVAPYIVDAKYVVDIDEPEDWEKAENALKQLIEANGNPSEL